MWGLVGLIVVVWAFYQWGIFGLILALIVVGLLVGRNQIGKDNKPKTAKKVRENKKHETPKNRATETTDAGSLLWNGKRKLTINYTNSAGETTDRQVDIRTIKASHTGEVYFQAYCHLRDETRTFRADRVNAITTAQKQSFSNFFDYMKSELGI